jgi:hypothetical protein
MLALAACVFFMAAAGPVCIPQREEMKNKERQAVMHEHLV